MLQYIYKRLIYMVITVFLVSIIAFIVIQLPPGDFLTSLIGEMEAQGSVVTQDMADALRARYGLDKPFYVQYFRWISGIVTRGDFGWSFAYLKPVSELIWDRFLLTAIVGASALLFSWVLAFPIGIVSAVKQYSFFDYIATFVGFLGLATPNFMLALVLIWVAYRYFGLNATGLFSAEFESAPWSIARVIDLLKHVWLPMVVVGTAGTAGLIRILRANLLDELRKPYVITARSKGLKKNVLLLKYPVRIAANPFVSSIAWSFPRLISGVSLTAIVLNLPTLGPLLLSSLKNQDMYLAGSLVLLISLLTVVGTLVSDMLLVWLDPRIRYE